MAKQFSAGFAIEIESLPNGDGASVSRHRRLECTTKLTAGLGSACPSDTDTETGSVFD